MKRKSKCWEGVREKMEARQSLQVKQEEVKSGSVTRGEHQSRSRSQSRQPAIRV